MLFAQGDQLDFACSDAVGDGMLHGSEQESSCHAWRNGHTKTRGYTCQKEGAHEGKGL
jgi:hypothetical protein